MKQLIVDAGTGKQEYSDMTQEEEAQRLAEIAKAVEDAVKKQEEEQNRKDALGRLKLSLNSETLDLLKVLNL
jgi:hypothetical protein